MARYLTTTLPYVNADPHLGHALEFVQADSYARALRLNGEDVFLTTGTDEHGAKIYEKAVEARKDPQAYADEYAGRFKAFAQALDISYDSFLRTTDPSHVAAEFWKRCNGAGDIYQAAYRVKYCVGCELEKTDSELDHGRCPVHPNLDIETREEENYFFRFSKYQEALLAHYRAYPGFVVPESRMRELIALVSGGLKDFSISRRKEKLLWGVPVPGDDTQVVYVWFDALVSYLSAIRWPADKENFRAWWPVTHFAGKDNLRQQSAMFQAMLLSAGLPLSQQVFIHGFITSGGAKMSKSLGNVINPMALIEKYGTDAVRYVLLRHVNPFEDSDLTEQGFADAYEGNLVNGLGNFVARVMTLAERHLLPVQLTTEDTAVEPAFTEKIEAFKFNEAMDLIWDHVAKGDAYITVEEPYKKIKTEPEAAKRALEKLARHIAKLAAHLAPAMPATAKIMMDAVRTNKKPKNLFPRI